VTVELTSELIGFASPPSGWGSHSTRQRPPEAATPFSSNKDQPLERGFMTETLTSTFTAAEAADLFFNDRAMLAMVRASFRSSAYNKENAEDAMMMAVGSMLESDRGYDSALGFAKVLKTWAPRWNRRATDKLRGTRVLTDAAGDRSSVYELDFFTENLGRDSVVAPDFTDTAEADAAADRNEESAERLAAVKSVLSGKRNARSLALLLAAADGATTKELAEKFDMSSGAVRVSLSTTRKRVREALAAR
jgi:RNA polymerase sigma factor (sigma-70 family)